LIPGVTIVVITLFYLSYFNHEEGIFVLNRSRQDNFNEEYRFINLIHLAYDAAAKLKNSVAAVDT